MLLSVIIPVYNVEKYVARAIQSVLQNDVEQDMYEIVVVDDESPDNSLAIVNDFARQHPNIRVISQKNKGLGGARNTGIQNASGKYLLFVDSDDWILPNSLKTLIETAETNQTEILEFAAEGISPQGKIVFVASESTNGKILDGFTYYKNVRYLNSACNKLYNRNFLESNGLLFSERMFIEDFEFHTRVYSKARRMMAIPYVAANFLQSPDSITRNTDAAKKQKMTDDVIVVLQKTKEAYLEYPGKIGPEEKDFFEERLGYVVSVLFFHLFKNKFPAATINQVKNQLVEQNLYYIDKKLHLRNKDLFRRVFLKNPWLFQIIQPLTRMFLGKS